MAAGASEIGQRSWVGALTLLLCSGPLFIVTIRGWGNLALFLSAIACIGVLIWQRADSPIPWSPRERLHTRVLLATFIGPTVAVVLSELLRLGPDLSLLDAPSRFLLAIPVFFVIASLRIDPSRPLTLVMAGGLAITLAHQWLAVQPHRWGSDRMATYFADPLVFGYLSLAFALMCLISIGARDLKHEPWWMLPVRVAGLGLGMYLSIRSESRTGWLALPIIIAIWLSLNVRVRQPWARAAVVLISLVAACAVALAAYHWFPVVHARVQVAIDDVVGYSFTGVAPVSPVGVRITFLRIAADLISWHPWAGVGDTSRAAPAGFEAFPYASPGAVNTAFVSGMHNQVITNTVRFGVLGGVSAAMLLLVPLFIYARRLRSGHPIARRSARLGLAYGVCIAVSSLTTEVIDLKYTASLYALMTAVLCGACLAPHGQE